MSSNVTIAVDLAKTVFQVVVTNENGKITERKRLTRGQFLRFWENRSPTRVLMEACGSAHYWGRLLIARGFEVILLPAHSVTPYVQRNKTDERDAEGLLEAAKSPRVHPVSVKSKDQQMILSLHRAREQWKNTRTARINGMRGLLREFGVVCATGAETLLKALPELLRENAAEVPPAVRSILWQMHLEVRELEQKMNAVENTLEGIAQENDVIRSLMQIPGIGLLTATAIYASVGDIRTFKSARHLASWLGITPKEHSSGTRRRLGRISKQGDSYLRMLLIHGARSMLTAAMAQKNKDRPLTHLQQWAVERAEAAHFNKAAVAVANKLARVIWAVWARGRGFDGNHLPQAA
jgi:transposase